jgi:hypothetical protein
LKASLEHHKAHQRCSLVHCTTDQRLTPRCVPLAPASSRLAPR